MAKPSVTTRGEQYELASFPSPGALCFGPMLALGVVWGPEAPRGPRTR